jgi:uncharacterized membrane protein YecN with MAPEG domain
MIVTPFYAALLALLFVGLSARVIVRRFRKRIALGDGSERLMQRAIRAHANCAEYVPIVLLLMGFAELQRAGVASLHVVGASALVGRVVHAVALSREPEPLPMRTAGMVLTFTAICLGAGLNLRALDWSRLAG